MTKIRLMRSWEKQEEKRVQHLENLRQKMYKRGCPHIEDKVSVRQREAWNGNRIFETSCAECGQILALDHLQLTIRTQ